MKLSQYILPTLKEDPADASVLSHKLMVRAGLIRKETAGMYIYLPLGLKALSNVRNIVKEEMDRAGALEFLMPELTASELWKESGRWDTMGPEMFRVTDRGNAQYALGPTHEEAFTNVMRMLISSYKDLPKTVYQINTKFRDEVRPRFGVIRSKEFIMKDAYSFDLTEDSLDESYQKIRQAYYRIFERCGLETIPVRADSGTMGGNASEEFMVASEIGEELLLLCDNCGYRANQEKAEYKLVNKKEESEILELEEISTPNVRTIEQLSEFFNCSNKNFLKSIVYLADEKPVMAIVTGDREINEFKLKNYLKATELELAPDSVVEAVTGAPVGFAGPVDKSDVRCIFDIAVKNITNGITGANKQDFHFKNVNSGRDFEINEEVDITLATDGDFCPECGKPMKTKRGIEVGHIFKLGRKYTEAMKFTVLNDKGQSVVPLMGCYGVGVTRTLSAVIEQNNDDRGIIWPMSVAPFQVHLVSLAKKDEDIAVVEKLYNELISAGIDVLYDDRKASPGFKFADADLIGIPLRLIAGKTLFNDNEIELKYRKTNEVEKVSVVEICEKIKSEIKKLKK